MRSYERTSATEITRLLSRLTSLRVRNEGSEFYDPAATPKGGGQLPRPLREWLSTFLSAQRELRWPFPVRPLWRLFLVFDESVWHLKPTPPYPGAMAQRRRCHRSRWRKDQLAPRQPALGASRL